MGPTPREWLGAGLLALVLVVLLVLLVTAALPDGEAEAERRRSGAFLRAPDRRRTVGDRTGDPAARRRASSTSTSSRRPAQITIVDAGAPGQWQDLPDELAAMGRTLDDVRALILTHAHSDHVGFAERIRRERGVPVRVHPDDAALARGEVKPVRDPNGTGRRGWSLRAIAGFGVFALSSRHGEGDADRRGRDVPRRRDARRPRRAPGGPRARPHRRQRGPPRARPRRHLRRRRLRDAQRDHRPARAPLLDACSTPTTARPSPPSRAWTASPRGTSCPATATPGRAGWRRRFAWSARAFRPSCGGRRLSRRGAPGATSRRPGRGRRGRASGPRRP